MQSFGIGRSGTVYLNMKDPAFLKRYYRFKTIEMVKGNEIYGSSPPDIFVGRVGYPNVYIGPLVPPRVGDTSVMGTPELWADKSIPEIVEYRSLLIRGLPPKLFKVFTHSKPSRIVAPAYLCVCLPSYKWLV